MKDLKLLNLIIILLLGFQINMQAQIIKTPSNEKPYWLEEGGLPQSEYFIYRIGQGENTSLYDAKKQAIDDVLQKIANEDGITYKIIGESKTDIENRNENDKVTSNITFKYKGKTIINGKEISVPALQETSDYYRQKSDKQIYECWVLVRIPKNKKFKEMPYYKDWQAAPIWRSALFPGWGQLYKSQVSKQEKKKGLILLIGEVVMLSGLIASQNLYSYNHEKAYNTQSISQRKSYLSNRDNWRNLRTGFAIGAAAIYLYSIIDAATNKKAKKYTNNENRFRIYPEINNNYCQLTLNLTFN